MTLYYAVQEADASEKKATSAAPAAEPKKQKVKVIDLPVTASVPRLSKDELNSYIEKEVRSKCCIC